jgi:hypothetical protein
VVPNRPAASIVVVLVGTPSTIDVPSSPEGTLAASHFKIRHWYSVMAALLLSARRLPQNGNRSASESELNPREEAEETQ